MAITTRQCNICKEEKHLSSDFHKNPQNADKLDRRCKSCRATQAKARYDKDLDKSRAYQRSVQKKYRESRVVYRRNYYALQRYGISGDELFSVVQRLNKEQAGLCAICFRKGDVIGQVKRPNTVRLVVDHDHQTGKLRALLCDACNKSLGQLREDPRIVESLLDYLRKHKEII